MAGKVKELRKQSMPDCGNQPLIFRCYIGIRLVSLTLRLNLQVACRQSVHKHKPSVYLLSADNPLTIRVRWAGSALFGGLIPLGLVV